MMGRHQLEIAVIRGVSIQMIQKTAKLRLLPLREIPGKILSLIHIFLQTSAEELLPLYEKKHLRLEYAFPAEEIWIPGNAGLTRQALSNLVENAMKYNREDGSLRLGVAQNADGEVLISVANSCAGIPEQSLDKIFEPFYCVDPSRSRKMGGAGLGLSIVKSIADRHGWRVQAESCLLYTSRCV